MASLGRAILEIITDADQFFQDLDGIEGKLGITKRNLAQFGSDASAMGSRLTAGVTLPIVALGAGVSKLAVDFESSFAGVRKTVNATEPEFAALAQGFRDLSTQIPVNVNELNAIGEAAGQLGIQKANILGFTDVVAKLGVTTNLAGDEAASALARIANITQMPQENFDRLGATIVGLGNNFATTEAEIVDFGLRIAGAGSIAGLSEAQILGIGTAMSSVGVEAEAGGTAVQKVLLSMVKAVQTGGPKLEAFAATAGMTASEFSTRFRDDAGAAFTAFVTGLGAQGDQAMGTLSALGLEDQRLIRSFLSLAGAGDLVSQAMDRANQEWAKGTALSAEANQRFATTESQFQLLWNRVSDLGISLGQVLLPILTSVVGLFERFMPVLKSAVDFFSNLPVPVQAGVVAFGGLLAALGPVLMIVGQVASAFAVLMPYLPALGTAVTTVMTVISGPIGWIGAALVGLGVIWMTWGDDITGVVTSTYEAVKTYLWDKLEPVLTPIIGLLQSVMDMFTAFGRLVGAVLGVVLQAHIDTVMGITQWLIDRLQPVFGPIGAAVEAFGAVFARVKDAVVGAARLLYEGVKAWMLDRFTAVVDGIKAKVDAVTGFFNDMYQAVVGGSFVPDMILGIQAEFAKLAGVMVAPAQAATDHVRGLFQSLTEQVSTTFSSWGSSLGGHIQSVIGGPIGGAFGSIASGVLNSVGTILTGGMNQLIGIGLDLAMKGLKAIGDKVWSGLKSIGSAVGGFFGSIFGGGNDTKGQRESFATQSGFSDVDALFDQLRDLGRDDLVHTALNVIGKKDTAANQAWMREVQAALAPPGFAAGGIVDAGAGMLAELHGRELVAPLPAGFDLASTLRSIESRPLEVTVISKLDGRTVARNQIRHIPGQLDFVGARS